MDRVLSPPWKNYRRFPNTLEDDAQGPGHQLLTLGYPMITSGTDARFALLGARNVGEETLNRFYILHCIAIPLAVSLLLAIHFWRVRKDGGISGPL